MRFRWNQLRWDIAVSYTNHKKNQALKPQNPKNPKIWLLWTIWPNMPRCYHNVYPHAGDINGDLGKVISKKQKQNPLIPKISQFCHF